MLVLSLRTRENFRLATLPYGLDLNVTKLIANLLTKPSVFYYLPIVSCNLISIKLYLLLLLLFTSVEIPLQTELERIYFL